MNYRRPALSAKATTPAAWVVRESEWSPRANLVREALFSLGNGYQGIRGFPEEPFVAGPSLPGVYLAGVFDPDRNGIPELVNIANILAVDITLGGERFQLEPGRIEAYQRVLDLKRGLLLRSLVYEAAGKRTWIEFERFTSVVDPHLAAQSVTVVPLDWSGTVMVTLWFDAGVTNEGGDHLRLLHAQHMGRKRLLMATETRAQRTRIGHAAHCTAWLRQASPPGPHLAKDGMKIGFCYEVPLECSQRAVFQRLVSTYTSRDPDIISVERSCLSDLRGLDSQAYGVRRRRHVRKWRRRWKWADIAIDGPLEDQRALRFAIFHLIQNAPTPGLHCSIAAKGMTGEGYRGHVFWDTEVFMLPFFIATNPLVARRLLRYRHHTLPGARRKARQAGYEGAMFAWESADSGEETCPVIVSDPRTGERVRVWCGDIEQHISGAVIYGAWLYVRATGDASFRQREFLEMLVETARFWASRAAFNRELGRYEIHDVIGPDEYHEHIDNNAYTNAIAAWNLRIACKEVRRPRERGPGARVLRDLGVTESELDRWREVSAGLFIPLAEDGALIEQHEGFFSLRNVPPAPLSTQSFSGSEKERMRQIHRSQVLKQADVVMLMVLMPECFSREAKLRNWTYYEPRTTHDSSLSPSVHSILASDLALRDPAYDYFKRSAFIDLNDRMGNSAQGLHFAAMGGTWQAVARGFLGMRLQADPLEVRSRLPRAWKSVTMHIHHRRRWYRVTAAADGTASLEKLPGQPS